MIILSVIFVLYVYAFVLIFPFFFGAAFWAFDKAQSWFDLFISSFTETN